MNTNSYKTFSAKVGEVQQEWFVIDAENQIVGRLASRVAAVLRGKHKPSFTPHVDTGDYVIIVNADKVRFSGGKETAKEYFRHTGYPGGDRVTTPRRVRATRPEFIIENAVKGMLPHNKLGRKMLGKLKVYSGPSHPHEAQAPKELVP